MCRTFSSCKKVSPQWEMDPVGIEPTSSRAIVPKHLTLEHGSERTRHGLTSGKGTLPF